MGIMEVDCTGRDTGVLDIDSSAVLGLGGQTFLEVALRDFGETDNFATARRTAVNSGGIAVGQPAGESGVKGVPFFERLKRSGNRWFGSGVMHGD
jgi:hypothetical protein